MPIVIGGKRPGLVSGGARIGGGATTGLQLVWTPEATPVLEAASDGALDGVISLPDGVTGIPVYAIDSGTLTAIDPDTGEVSKDGYRIGQGPLVVAFSVSGVTPSLPPKTITIQVKPVAPTISLEDDGDSGDPDDLVTNSLTWPIKFDNVPVVLGRTYRLKDGGEVIASKTAEIADVTASMVSFPVSDLPDKLYEITADVVNGQAVSDDSNTLNITLDTTPPAIESLSPANGAVGVAVGSNLVLTFNENVVFGADVAIAIYRADATLIEEFDESDIGGPISISGAALTVNPSSNLATLTSFFVLIAMGSITDVAGNAFGIPTAGVWSFTTEEGEPGSGDNLRISSTGNTRISSAGNNRVYA